MQQTIDCLNTILIVKPTVALHHSLYFAYQKFPRWNNICPCGSTFSCKGVHKNPLNYILSDTIVYKK